MYQRRKNLNGIQLKINNVKSYKGKLHKEILALFREEFNFTIEWLPFPGSYGTYDPINKSWNGMMKELTENEIDLGPYDFTQLAIRNMVASPGLTLTKTYVVVHFWRAPNHSPGWFSMLNTFSIEFWILSIVAIIIIFLSLHLTQLMEPKYKKSHSIYVLIAIIKAFLSQPFDEQTLLSKRLSSTTSFLVFTLSIMGFFVFAAYTSCLTSILAANSVNIPFTTMDEFAQYADFKLSCFQGGATATWLRLRTLETKEMEDAYTKNIVPYLIMNGNSNAEKWIASSYGARTGFVVSNGYFQGLKQDGAIGIVSRRFLKFCVWLNGLIFLNKQTPEPKQRLWNLRHQVHVRLERLYLILHKVAI